MARYIMDPIPGQENTISVSVEPETTYARLMPNTVSTGKMAFLRMYLRNIFFSLIPVTRKVII